MTDSIDAGKMFIWSQIGELLKKIDDKRILSLTEKNPDYSLSLQTNDELMKIISELNKKDIIEIDFNKISEINYKDNIFREIVKYLHTEPSDLLSVGAFVTGRIKSETAFLDLGGIKNE